MSNSTFEPWPLNESMANVLGLPLIAVTDTAQLMANGREWIWFEPVAQVAIWQGPDFQHGFSANSLENALDCVEQRALG